MKRAVLDKGFVELVGALGNDLTTVNAARVSFGNHKETLDDRDSALIQYLAKNGHTSPFRHIQLQFHVRAPEFVARQWLKHMVGCGFTDLPWNEISQRYTEVPLDFYVPETWYSQLGKQTSGAPIGDTEAARAADYCEDAYKEIRAVYKELIKLGASRELARIVLPMGVYTEWYWTASLQAVAHFVLLRADFNAQKEIQEYANAVAELAQNVAPRSFEELLTAMRG